MFLKIFVPGAAAVVGGLYVTGIGLGADYSRDVAKPPHVVYDKLTGADLATLARNSGFVQPPRIARTGDGQTMTFQLLSGKEVAMQMNVVLHPIDNGEATRVTGDMTSYSLPAGNVLPAMHTEDAIEGLIEMAMNDQLDQFEPGYDAAKARAAKKERNRQLMQARAVANPAAFHQDAVTMVNTKFEEASKRFKEQDAARERARDTAGVTFRPGKPMVDAGN